MELRAYRGEADLRSLVDVVNSAALADTNEGRTDVEELRSDLSRPDIDQEQGIAVAEAGGLVTGFVFTMVNDSPTGTPTVHVGLRSRPESSAELDLPLIQFALKGAQEIARQRRRPVEVLLPVNDTRIDRVTVMNELGFEVARYFFRMRAPLDPAPMKCVGPEGYHVRSLSDESELIRWVELFNESFIDHWHFIPQTISQATHFALHDPNYCPDGDLVAVAPDGTFAAFCQCVIRKNENEQTGRFDGWMSLLGTRCVLRGLGLGRMMLGAGMNYLRSRGMKAVHLGVDAANPTGALSLYESFGFAVTHRRIAFVKYVAC